MSTRGSMGSAISNHRPEYNDGGSTMRTRTIAVLVFLAGLTVGAYAQAPASWPSVVAGYRGALQKGGIVGSSLMVVREGRIVARQNEGLQNLDRREPVTNDTI